MCLKAFFSALTPARVGLTVKVTLPAVATVLLPRAKRTRAGRHFPFNLTKPDLHFLARAEKTPWPKRATARFVNLRSHRKILAWSAPVLMA